MWLGPTLALSGVGVTVLACTGVVVAFVLMRRLARWAGNPPWLSPVVLTALLAWAICAALPMPVARFEQLTAPLRWALGPAIVALGALVHAARAALRAQLGALLVAVGGGTLTGIASAAGLARLAEFDPVLGAALVTKTVSTPFAVLIQTRIGGPVAIAAAVAVVTGVIGALVVPPTLSLLRFRGSATTGLAVGVSSHIVGTDWLSRRDGRAAAFAGGATVLAGLVASVLVPLLWPWLQRLAVDFGGSGG